MTSNTAQKGVRALVVDDNRDAADSLVALLRALGIEAQRAFDGGTAMLLAAQLKPEVVFLDLVMPRMDGFEVLAAMREIRGMESTPFFAVTGTNDDKTKAHVQTAGFAGHMLKPVTLAVLSAALESIR